MSSSKSITSLATAAVIALLLAACAAPPKAIHTADTPTWNGRIAIKVESDPVQHLSAGFTLQGSEEAGVLGLFTPLGGKAAEVKWQSAPASHATVTTDQGAQTYSSADAALAQLTGADLPVAELFAWLSGSATSSKPSQSILAWKADLTRLADGRITAVRELPTPRMEIRVILEQ